MTVFTNVSDDVLEPGDPIRSVDILAIKENTNYNHQNTVLEILQEDIFTTSGTFTKATGFDANDTVMIFLVGGGASGQAGRIATGTLVARGGTCGSGVVVACRYADMPSSSFTLAVGAGGAAVTRTTDFSEPQAGLLGGTTSLINDTARIAIEALGGRRAEQTTNRAAGGISSVLLLNGIGNVLVNPGVVVDVSFLSINGTLSAQYHTSSLAFADNEYASLADFQKATRGNLPQQIFGSGGSAARDGNTNRTSWNPKVPALFATGGDGSGTANGQDGAFPGGGGGGCARQSANATSGAGGAGGMIVQYYRGRVSVDQVMSAMER